MIVANILHSFSTHIIRAIENKFYEKGFHIIVCNADDEPDKEKEYIEMLMANKWMGLLFFQQEAISTYTKMKKSDFPIVFMDRTISDIGIETVVLDNDRAAELAVNQFVDNGYRKLLLLLRQSSEILVLGLNVFKDIKAHWSVIN